MESTRARKDLITRLHGTADRINAFDIERGYSSQTELLSNAVIDLRQAANEIEALTEKLEDAEKALNAAMEDLHPSVQAYFAKYPRRIDG